MTGYSIRIETSRLAVRNYSLSDAASLYKMITNNKVYLSDSMPLTIERNASLAESHKHIQQTIKNAETGSAFACGIFLKNSDGLIGQISVINIDWRVPKCELSYFIAEENKGQHYATEAVGAVTDYCFSTFRMIKVFLRIASSNHGSKRIAQQCGYTKQGIMHNEFKTATGKVLDLEYWEIINPA